MTVCRACCCGTVKKHPDYDHEGQLHRLRALAAGSGGRVRVRTADCLDTCENSNVVVVKPPGGQPVWLGFVLHDAVMDDLERWLADGGPLPATLELNRIPSPARRG
ncbi:(2Fe-2S) ferredoxin domain-containing protein [Saccharothrix australiensis]|uniref:(2Fe-2S) ferredoxin domain-containing protein n=1 Tax=Saccharothrix australiensis TaxID=2072 RepID=UPI001FE59C37|nr:(2Fe-2S) ferredoxin domain-containing protein [Saccharothrix australiensis]